MDAATTRLWLRRALMGAGIALLVMLLVLALRAPPVAVDIGQVTRGPLTVTVDEEGETRVREAYVISAPVGGRLLRVTADAGDPAQAGETILARIEPSAPAFLDRRSETEAKAQISAAKAALALAEADVRRAAADRELARTELERIEQLFQSRTVSQAALDRARASFERAQAAMQTAQAAVDVARFQLESAQAMLIRPDNEAQSGTGATCCLNVRAPVSGRVLQVLQESETVVAPGTPLVSLGDPDDLEIVVDLLSMDAVKISEGAQVEIVGWGGDSILAGVVRRIEPFGFTKISALGVEEQRVNVVIDFTGRAQSWQALGHGYRVEARIIVWQGEDVLQVPASALFRLRGDWAVFVVDAGVARIRRIALGQRNDHQAQVLSGLEAGAQVVLHPGNAVEDGVRVTARPN
ncbi:MAG: HlyD family efflux transporter periplasmic adaptor subunit [Sphingomonadales bacterium]